LYVTAQAATPQKPLSLIDCYRLALKRSETIAIDAEVIKESEARFIQAFSGILPHVSFSSVEKKTDPHAADQVDATRTHQRNFVFRQALFSGFKEFAGMKGAHLEHQQRINEKIRAEQLLFTDVSDAFYLLIEERKDLEALQRTVAALKGRIDELRQREKLGRSRRSEVVNTRAQLYSVQADLALVTAQEAVARQLLEFLTGRSIGDLADSSNAMPPLNPEIFYTSRVSERPDVQAAGQAAGVAQKQVTIARAGFFPSVSLLGNYYVERTTSPQESRWDAALAVDIPIFEGGLTYGQYKEAQARARQAQLQSSLASRLALQDIRDAYVQYQTGVEAYKTQRKALAATELNFYLQKQDYKYNLVNNLDVLTAIQSLEDTRRNYLHSLYEAKRQYWQLRVASGEIPIEN
jgi:outer membrane protein TolC